MKLLILVMLLLIGLKGIAQTDENGNPVFNSVPISEEVVGSFTLLANYYTLKNNLDNKTSSVYISESPNLDEVISAAIQLPSDFFLVMKGQNLINLVMLTDIPKRQYLVIDPATGTSTEYPCALKGDLTENRALEIMKSYAPDAKKEGNILQVNGRTLNIISSKAIRSGVLELIERNHLDAGDSSGVKMLSKADLRSMVLEKSKTGGELDFFTEIKGHEMDGVQVKPGVFTSKISIALYKWGKANYDLGVNNVEDALEIWSGLKGREANQREKEYIRMGFNKELEQ